MSYYILGIERDAVNIFSKYISHDAPYPIKISDELRSQAISKFEQTVLNTSI